MMMMATNVYGERMGDQNFDNKLIEEMANHESQPEFPPDSGKRVMQSERTNRYRELAKMSQ